MNDLIFLRPIAISNKIRIGPNSDGGYVLYKPSLDNIDVLFNYGVGWDSSFEEDFSFLTKKRVHMFDPTMVNDNDFYIDYSYCMQLLKSGRLSRLFRYLRFVMMWTKKIANWHEREIYFHNEGIANRKTKRYDTFCNHIKQLNSSMEHILLKIDIEENEYGILIEDEFYAHLDLVDQIIIEFHNLKNRMKEFRGIINKLKDQYEIIHIHGNNYAGTFTLYREYSDICFPDVVEMTFVKRSSILSQDIFKDTVSYPVEGLDYPNNLSKEDYKLRFD